jgi:two-component system sensor kinase FixL
MHRSVQDQELIADEASEFEALMEAAVDAVIVIESTGKIVAFSRSAEALFGYAAEEVIGESVDILMPEPYRSSHPDFLRRYQATGDAKIIGIGREVSALRKDGTLFPAWLSVGEAVSETRHRFVGFVRDLSEQHAAETERHLLETRLAHVSRLSLLGEMAAGIAHEINQPLTAVANYSQAAKNILESGADDVDTLKAACAGISEQAQRAGDVITNLRNFVRKRKVEKSGIDPSDLINGIMVLIKADAVHEGVDVEVEVEDGLPEIYGNSVQLQQVLLNLTRNAVDATGASIRREKKIEIHARRNGEHIEFLVSDRGSGVPDSLKDAIFNPFFSTKSGGLGVGLAISRTIVDAHGGELTFRKRDGGGSTFVVSLPILKA